MSYDCESSATVVRLDFKRVLASVDPTGSCPLVAYATDRYRVENPVVMGLYKCP
jgi:hypothetical protein